MIEVGVDERAKFWLTVGMELEWRESFYRQQAPNRFAFSRSVRLMFGYFAKLHQANAIELTHLNADNGAYSRLISSRSSLTPLTQHMSPTSRGHG